MFAVTASSNASSPESRSDVAMHEIALRAADPAHDAAGLGLRFADVVHDRIDARIAGIELGDSRHRA